VRVGLPDEQQTTLIRMAANSVARATNCHLTNTHAMSAASARIAATARRRHLYMCICRGLGCGLWK
jgi:adenylate kinase